MEALREYLLEKQRHVKSLNTNDEFYVGQEVLLKEILRFISDEPVHVVERMIKERLEQLSYASTQHELGESSAYKSVLAMIEDIESVIRKTGS